MEKILLIAFKYPPYAGVGGFRWSKLSKYLAEMGYQVHVVTVDWKQHGENTLLNDVQHPNIIIHTVPSLYFHNLKYRRYNNSFIGNIKRIIKAIYFKFINLIWYDDEAQLLGYSLLPFCSKLIEKEKITNVIATGHPFMVNYWAARLKKTKPEINLIQDFQDPWNDDEIRRLPLKLMAKRSLQHEVFALNNCNVLFAVTKGLLDLLSKKIYTPVEKVVIPNGFDTDVIEKNVAKRDFTLIYAGALYSGREEPLEAFLRAVTNIETIVPEIKVFFYGSFPNNLKKQYNNLFKTGVVSHFSPVSPEKIHKLMYESFSCLQFNACIYDYLVSTKIYEYASLRRPTLSINYGGEIDTLIKKHKLGISVNGDDIEQIQEAILKLYDIWKQNPHYEISPEELEIYHYRNLAKQVAKYLK